ncbi:MAG TPA: cytochrome c [Bacteroidia bacterium]|nr:cytochrome c [Bacteroidia bacterium]
MENIIDKIDRYLDGKMSAAEQATFEKEIGADPNLQQQIYAQKNLRAGITRLGMRSQITSTFRKLTMKNKIYKWGIATVAVVAVGAAVYFGTKLEHSYGGTESTYELPKLNEQGKPEWATADKNLPTQLFTINPARDTVIETTSGIVFAIPAGAFLDAQEPIMLEIREALTGFDIIKGGLSTTSDGQLLETGGMFYLNARNGEKSLLINPAKPVYANVPTNEIKPGMQLFEGERRPDGSINWKNPKPVDKQLIAVDIHTLNFYPRGFLETVAALGFDTNNKKVTDSIYYSYAGRKSSDSLLSQIEMVYSEWGHPINGAELFSKYCASCHSASASKVTGPGLKGVLDRIPGGKWKYDYVRNSSALIAKGDLYANKIFREYNMTTMTAFPGLSNEEIDAILYYANSGGYKYQNEIDPARIAGIWNDKFQNTIIATKEFEERLQTIFLLGQPSILVLYLNNLDKKLYQIDSMAAGPDMAGNVIFHEYFLRHDGGLSVSQSHMNELQAYFALKRKAVQLAAEKTYGIRKQKEQKEDNTYTQAKNKQMMDDGQRAADNFTKEFEINLREAYRQLGYNSNKPVLLPANNYYSFNVTTPGWNNVDKYVLESTVNRTTLDYTDPRTGKKAVIKYEPLKVNVGDFQKYDQLIVYLVSDSLPAFRKLSGSAGIYTEKLDELLPYSLVVLGENDWKWFYNSIEHIKPGNSTIDLLPSTEKKIRKALNRNFSSSITEDFGKEIDVMKITRQYEIQTRTRKKQEEIDREIMRVIFPDYKDEPRGLPPLGSSVK